MTRIFKSIGLMSGTSLDGVDAAIITTDGKRVLETGQGLTLPYGKELRAALKGLIENPGGEGLKEIENEMTRFHAEAVARLPEKAEVIGFHGQTILHRPERGFTWQIGNAALLSHLTGIPVVSDFRSRDVAAGGQGAPLVPVFHRAITADCPKPLAVINIGGVANVTWIGEGENELLAFDTGPGNAMIDDLIFKAFGETCDWEGKYASLGRICKKTLSDYLADEFFAKTPPKSLDRNYFPAGRAGGLKPEDAAATLTAFTARAIAASADHFPKPPGLWLISGGGRLNPVMMRMLKELLPGEVAAMDEKGWNGDFLEAQAFAFLAVRSLLGLPISFPGTTGVSFPMTGGIVTGEQNLRVREFK